MKTTASDNNKNIIERTLLMQRDLKQYAYSLTVNQDDADDLLQDTYLKVIQYSSYFRSETNLKAWVYNPQNKTSIFFKTKRPFFDARTHY
ncbi:MAG TPA: sigma factor [Bacteroidales bacterium]|nr:sigma factor [Bacteroidales bacterium]